MKPPDRVWQGLPGGPVARHPVTGEAWQLMGLGPRGYYFRHRGHPQRHGARCYAWVNLDGVVTSEFIDCYPEPAHAVPRRPVSPLSE
jgi:hypothetical protein